MRKIYSLLYISLIVLFVGSSCAEKDDQIEDKGTLISATYNPTTKRFTLNYSKGASETVIAYIDKSVTPPSASATLPGGTVVYVNDANIEGKASIGSISNNQYVNNWIYEEMNIYYLWNDLIPKKPNFELNPYKFFDSLLNKYDENTNPEGDRDSWIQENYAELIKSLSGVKSDEIGFEYMLVAVNEARTKYYALVTYPKKGSDAYAKGIERGRFITAVDGKDITLTNYRSIFSGSGNKSLSIKDWHYDENRKEYILKDSNPISVKMEENFAEIPVYMDSVYNINGTKIGYMVYNFFAEDNDDDSHDYDRLLMDRLKSIQDDGATEMILDLRYNGGGSVSTAIALASALVKDRSTDKVLVTAEYNDLVHAAFKKEYGADYNKDFFIDKIEYGRKEIKVPNLNLSRLYVLVSGSSASASEFIINGLKPYMDVILIGETTYGKNVGSISLFKKDDPKNKWGMQPIIVKFYNSLGESDFTTGFEPDFEVDEFTALDNRLVKFGDTEDPLLSVALDKITGGPKARSVVRKHISTYPNMFEVKGTNSIFKDKSRFEMIDDVRGDKIKKLLNK